MPALSMTTSDADGRVDLDRAEFKINWDAASRVLAVPFQILSGGNRITLLGQVEAPAQAPGPWQFKIGGGTVVLNSPARPGRSADPQPYRGQRPVRSGQTALRRSIRANSATAMSASRCRAMPIIPAAICVLPRGSPATRMSADALKRLWPVFVAPKVRDWFNDHLISGSVERVVIAVNAPLEYAQSQRSAGAGRRLVDRCAGHQLRGQAGRRPAGAARRRSHRSYRRARRADRARQGDRRPAVGAQARDVVRPVRSARYRAARAAGARSFQARRTGAGRGRACRHGSPARRLGRAVRSGDDARHDERAGSARHAAEARSAAGFDQLRDRGRCDEFFRRAS